MVIANRCGVLVILWILGARMKQDKEGSKEELFDLSEGFVGWTGNINHPVLMLKIYGSCISPDFVAKTIWKVCKECRD